MTFPLCHLIHLKRCGLVSLFSIRTNGPSTDHGQGQHQPRCGLSLGLTDLNLNLQLRGVGGGVRSDTSPFGCLQVPSPHRNLTPP